MRVTRLIVGVDFLSDFTPQYYSIMEIAVRSCKSGGIDVKIHGVSIIGRVDMNEDEVAANFSFLTVDESESKESGLVRKTRRKTEGGTDSHSNKVFVWGLNDRSQLGSGNSDSKVCLHTCTCISSDLIYSYENC